MSHSNYNHNEELALDSSSRSIPKLVVPNTGTSSGGGAGETVVLSEKAHQRTAKAIMAQEAVQQRRADFESWLANGSDDLHRAWVDVSPCANDHAVTSWELPKIVEVIRKEGHLDVIRYERTVEVDLTEVTAKVNQLYRAGFEAALRLNRKTYERLLAILRIEANPEDVEPVVEQPKKNEKVFYLTAVRLSAEEYPCERTRYHDPVAMGKDKAKDAKMRQVPGVTFAGTFDPHRDASYLYQTTGLYTLDADALDNVQAAYERIIKDPSVVLCFRSITGSGLKVIVYGPRVSTAEEYTKVYNRIFLMMGREWGIADKLDVATKDCSRLCFLSYDPEAYVNWKAVPLALDELPQVEQEPSRTREPVKEKKQVQGKNKTKERAPKAEPKPDEGPQDIDWAASGGIPDLTWEDISLKKCCDALRYISPRCDHETWRVVAAALRLGYGNEAFDIFDYWSSLAEDDAYPGRNACWNKWESHERGEGENAVTPKSILKLGRERGWRPPNERVNVNRPSVAGESKETEQERAARLAERAKSYEVWTPSQMIEVVLDPNDDLLGNRYLRKGGGLLVCAPTGVGKSSFEAQTGICWAVGREAFGIKPVRPLKILTIQAEDDKADGQEMMQGIRHGLCLSPDEIGLADENCLYLPCNDLAGDGLLAMLPKWLELYRPDLVRLNPLNSYIGCDVSDQGEVTQFLRSLLNPILEKHRCGFAGTHHTTKTVNRDTSKWRPSDWAYSYAGSAEMANWARAILVIDPTHDPRVFKFYAAKRGKRLEWGGPDDEPVYVRHFKHSREHIFWVEADAEDIRNAEMMAKQVRGGPELKFDNGALLKVLLSAEEGMTRREWHREIVKQRLPGTVDPKTGNSISQAAFYKRVSEILDAGKIVERDGRLTAVL